MTIYFLDTAAAFDACAPLTLDDSRLPPLIALLPLRGARGACGSGFFVAPGGDAAAGHLPAWPGAPIPRHIDALRPSCAADFDRPARAMTIAAAGAQAARHKNDDADTCRWQMRTHHSPFTTISCRHERGRHMELISCARLLSKSSGRYFISRHYFSCSRPITAFHAVCTTTTRRQFLIQT